MNWPASRSSAWITTERRPNGQVRPAMQTAHALIRLLPKCLNRPRLAGHRLMAVLDGAT
jgi:hypothetical protein